MPAPRSRPPTGHVYRREGARGPVWYAKYRLADDRQVQKRLGPAWTARGRPAAGYLTKRRAEEWLAETLRSARHGELAAQNETGVSFAEAAAEWLRYIEFDRERKPGTVKGYGWVLNSQLLPAFGELPIEALSTEMIEAWLAGLGGTASSRQKALVLLHGILKRARRKYGLKLNAAVDVEKPTLKRSGDIPVYSPPRRSGRSCGPRSRSRIPRCI